MGRYQSFGGGNRTGIEVVGRQGEGEGGGEDVEEGGGGEAGPLLTQQHPALPVLVRCLSSPWSQT